MHDERETTVWCDGKGDPLDQLGEGSSVEGHLGENPPEGHPKVYLNFSALGYVVCPYCSRRFERDTPA